MKKIVPFNNVLTFKTDISEITAISLEHKINISNEAISGIFNISGEYKQTDGQLEREKFNFELPFDIALGCEYDPTTLVVDIDDFRYEITDRNLLKVNIDLYIDGEILEEPKVEESKFELEKQTETPHEDAKEETRTFKEEDVKEPDIDLLDDLKDEKESDSNINISNENNIFNGFDSEDVFVTYRVYRVLENDTIDKILIKYNTTLEELSKYNDTKDIKPGDKLIIPANDK